MRSGCCGDLGDWSDSFSDFYVVLMYGSDCFGESDDVFDGSSEPDIGSNGSGEFY